MWSGVGHWAVLQLPRAIWQLFPWAGWPCLVRVPVARAEQMEPHFAEELAVSYRGTELGPSVSSTWLLVIQSAQKWWNATRLAYERCENAALHLEHGLFPTGDGPEGIEKPALTPLLLTNTQTRQKSTSFLCVLVFSSGKQEWQLYIPQGRVRLCWVMLAVFHAIPIAVGCFITL